MFGLLLQAADVFEQQVALFKTHGGHQTLFLALLGEKTNFMQIMFLRKRKRKC